MEEALLRRLPPNHEKWAEIRRNFKKGQAGYKGELELDFHLGYLDDDNFHIFQDLRIPIEEERIFQMDTLILTPQFALIIESKNKPCPTHSLVAIGYPSTIVQTSPDNQHIFHRLLHAEHILDKIDELVDASPAQNLTPYQTKKITQLLLDQHTPSSFDALTHYSIEPNELILGVPCPLCPMQTMQRIFGKWLCPKCDATSTDAHQLVVRDHLLLRSPLSNAQVRQILQVDSTHTVKRLLQAMGISSKGTKKGRVYFLEE